MRRIGMFSLVSRALGMLAMVFFAVVALIWQWSAENPRLALVVIPSVIAGLWWPGKHEREKQQTILDARVRDEHVPSMSPREYEQFTARQLERAGWKVLHCGRPGDQGCDVLAELRGFRLVVQAKKYAKAAGNTAVQEVISTRRHNNAQIMAVVCPCGFTKSARELAATNGVRLLHHSALGTLEGLARIPHVSN